MSKHSGCGSATSATVTRWLITGLLTASAMGTLRSGTVGTDWDSDLGRYGSRFVWCCNS